jgi:hypothetical protein
VNRAASFAAITYLLAPALLVAQTQSSSAGQARTPQSSRPDAASSPTVSRSTSRMMPAGTGIEVRINDTLSSDSAQAGERFTGEVATDVTDANGRVLIARGAEVNGRVLSASPSGRLSNAGELELSISTIRSEGRALNVTVEPFMVKGESHTKSNTTKIGGGAALGAIIGAIAGGGKGAAIGAGVGAAAGTGAAAATGKREARVESEAVLKFVTANDIRIAAATEQTTPQSRTAPSDDSRDDQEPVLRRRDNTAPASTSTTSGKSQTTSPATTETQAAAPGVARSDAPRFSLRDRRVITNCIAENSSTLSASVRSSASAGLGVSQQLNKGATLPKTLQTRVRSLPLACDRELPALPGEFERVIYAGKVMLLDSNGRILDVLELEP